MRRSLYLQVPIVSQRSFQRQHRIKPDLKNSHSCLRRQNRGKGVSVALPQATSRVRSNENDVNLTALNTIQNLGSAIREGITMPKRNLPVFDGDPLQYFGFLKRFDEIVLKQISEPPLQLEYLIDMCVGKAADAVRSCIPRLLHCKRLSTDWQVTLAVSTSWFKHI